MKQNLPFLATSALVLAAAANEACAQYAPPAPFPGFLNEHLRANDPYMNQWDFGGVERLRFEYHQGYGVAGSPGKPAKPNNDFRGKDADVYNSYELSRLRVHLGYTETWWSVYVEGQSSLTLDDKRSAYFANPTPVGTVNRAGDGPESDTIALYQAYVTIGNHKEFPLSLKVGRQELLYGEERLVGPFGWNNIGRVFDAAKVRWQNAWVGADFFTSRVVIPEDGRFNVDNDYDWFSGMYATSMKIPKSILDLYFLARNASPKAIAAEPSPQFPQPSARDIYTVGGRLKSKPDEFGRWDYTLEGAYQFGDFRDTRAGAPPLRLDQDAFMVVARGGYTFADAWGKPRLGLEFDYGSGDANPTDNKHGTFDNLFPTNHKFFGSMDLVSLQNIEDLGANLTLAPHPRVSLALMANAFWLANTHDNFYTVAGAPRGGTGGTAGAGFGINPGYSSYVGSEVTVVVGWAATRFAQIEAGCGHFFHGDYISQSWSTIGARDTDFAYLQLGLKF